MDMNNPQSTSPSPTTSATSPAPTGEVLVRVENVSKKFCRDLKRSLWYGVRDMAAELVGPDTKDGGLRPDEFWAIDTVSFELRRGECLGLIGRNGAGKTTLLKLLNGLIKPDTGRIEMRGRIGALIALGAGFNPILTGRENIYVNGSVLGLSKREIDAKLNDIIDFSEIGAFIDSPVRSYSSGMHVRLGFSVAAVLIQPDILFLDEVLAVGDIGFTIKCLNTVRALTQRSAVVFVSHNMQYISAFCTRVMFMEHGAVRMDSLNVPDGIDRYFAMIKVERQESGTGGAAVHSIGLVPRQSDPGNGEPCIEQHEPVDIDLAFDLGTNHSSAIVRVFICDESMSNVICFPLMSCQTSDGTFPPGEHRVRLPVGSLDLNAGRYSFLVAVIDSTTRQTLCRVQGLAPFRVTSSQLLWCKIVRPVSVQPAAIRPEPGVTVVS